MISWNFELQRFCRNFVLILMFSFYKYFTEVLCAAFHKIKYFDIVNISKFLTTFNRVRISKC